jgi:hypothetical protein
VAVEKLGISVIRQNLGDRKCPGEPRKSFIGHPDTICFQRIYGKGVFQQPRLFSTTESGKPLVLPAYYTYR